MAAWSKERFTVAAKLFQELGERLVGSPAMALAELVKNSYDADAYHVEIQLKPGGEDEIVLRDSGHGMTRDEFTKYWMRLGTRHKEEERVSEFLGRTMSGSKGVGRIAAELLSHSLELVTTSASPSEPTVEARLNWDEALATEELVDVVVQIRTVARTPGVPPGTTIKLKNLKHEWDVDEIHELAKEIWRLQP
ncbi:MAG: ATP-binding protein, partial [Thermoplasmatota archaeon]